MENKEQGITVKVRPLVTSEDREEQYYINTRGATLNYVLWARAREVYCADKNSPGTL